MTDPLQTVEHLNAQENLAELTAAYFQALVRHDFSRAEALELTHTWLASMIDAADRGGDDE